MRDQFLEHDFIRIAQHAQSLRCDIADDSHGKAGSGERMPPYDVFRQAEHFSGTADFILEQFPQRFDQFKPEFFRQTTDVVMELDIRRRARIAVARLDHIGIERSLRQELRPIDRRRLALEHLDKLTADDLPFLLRISNPRKFAKERLGGVIRDQVDFKMIPEGGFNEFPLIFSQQSVVDEDAHELVADRLVQERGDDG